MNAQSSQLAPTRATTLHAALWAALGSLIRYALAGIITLILTRLLTPRDFGLLALTVLAYELIGHGAVVGFHDALIQHPHLTAADRDAAFWSVLLAAGLSILFVLALAPLIADWYEVPSLAPLLLAMSAAALLRAIGTVPRADLSRRLDFRTPVLARILGLLIGGAGAILLAALGAGAWSLVAEHALIHLVGAVLVWRAVTYRPRWHLDRSALRRLWTFAPSVSAFTLLVYGISEADDQLIGWRLGAEAVGYYALAYSLMAWPVRDVLGGVAVVLYPVFARVQDDLPRLHTAYLESLQLATLFAFPVLALVAITAPVLVPWLLGPRWTPVILTLQILALNGLRESTGMLNGQVYRALGQPLLHTLLALCSAACYLTAFWIGLDWGIAGVAFFYALTGLLLQPVSWWLILRITHLSLRDWLHAVAPAALAAVAMSAVTLVVLHASRPLGSLPALLITGPVSAAVYAAALRFFTPLALIRLLRTARYLISSPG